MSKTTEEIEKEFTEVCAKISPPNMKKGDRVFEKNDRSDRATLTDDPSNDGTVELIWDYHRNPTRYKIDRLEVVDSELEKQLVTEIQDKVVAATYAFDKAFQILSELSELKDNHYELESMIDTTDLENLIDNNGWSSSSLWC